MNYWEPSINNIFDLVPNFRGFFLSFVLPQTDLNVRYREYTALRKCVALFQAIATLLNDPYDVY